MVLNNQVPTRKEHIIHLSIVSPQIFDKTNNWSVQEKVYLNSDHKMISFELAEKKSGNLFRSGTLERQVGLTMNQCVKKKCKNGWMEEMLTPLLMILHYYV